jgi:cytochrome c biogenesis protein
MNLSESARGGRRLFAALRSLKLTVFLVSYLGIASALSTFIPQMEPAAHYRHFYPGAVAEVILATGFDHFFSSAFFLAPSFCFFVNLAACTLYRFARELKKKAGKNFGPDILHGGLLLLIVFAFLGVFNRMEGSITLAPGESVLLPGGETLVLENFEFIKYPDGRPRAWISTVTVFNDRGPVLQSYALEVNHPVQLKGFTLYQWSYRDTAQGLVTVIQAVRDPLYSMVLTAFILIGGGTCITLFGKLRRLRKNYKEVSP